MARSRSKREAPVAAEIVAAEIIERLRQKMDETHYKQCDDRMVEVYRDWNLYRVLFSSKCKTCGQTAGYSVSREIAEAAGLRNRDTDAGAGAKY